MHIRKYNDIVFLKFLIIFYFLQTNSIRELYRKIKANQIAFDEKLPSIQTISYRKKKIDKEKLSRLMKKLIGSIATIDSTKLKNNEKLINFERKKWLDVKVWIEWMLIGTLESQ